LFSYTLAASNGVCTCSGMRSDYCSKAIYRELKNESFEHTDEL